MRSSRISNPFAAAPGEAPAQNTTGGSVATQRFTLRDFVMVLFKYKSVVIFTFLATVLGTLTWLWIRSDSYETSAKLVIKFTREAADPRTSLSPSTTRVLPATRPDINTEAELIKSYALIDEVITKMHLDEPVAETPPPGLMKRAKYELKRVYRGVQDVLDDIQVRAGLKERLTYKEKVIITLIQGLKVESVKDSSVVKVSLSSPIREGAGSVVNTLIEVYRRRRLAVEMISGKVDFFGEQAKLYGDRVRDSEQRLQELKQRFEISSLPEQTTLLLRNLSDSERNARESADVVRGAEAKLALLKEQLQRLPRTSVSSQVESRNVALDQLNQRRADLELERQKLISKYEDSHVLVQDIDRQIKRLSELIAETQATVSQSQTVSINTAYVDIEKEMLVTSQFLTSARARLEGQQQAVTEYDRQLSALRGAEIAYNQLSRDIMLNDETYRLHRRNVVEATAAEALGSRGISSIEVVDPAVDPIMASGIRKTYLMGGALALGLLLAIGLAFLLEGLDSGVDSTDDLEEHLGRPMWGSVLVSRTSKKHPSVLESRGSDFVGLAAKLAASAIGRRPHTLVVQAANAGAGATTVTSGIARALAETYGLKTVVIDASKHSAVGLLGCSPMPDRELPLPSGNVAWLWNVSPTLSVASFGNEVSPESRTAAVEILDALRASASYDFILVDAGESLPQHLRALFTQCAAGVVVVAEWGRTRSEVLDRLQEESRRDGVQLIAGILNKRRFLIPEPLYRVL